MSYFQGGIAVITGAASGFGLEASRIAARMGMKIVMADVQADALELSRHEIEGLGAEVLPVRTDVSKADAVDALAQATLKRFGAPHFVFNNAGVGAGGLVWEHSAKDWEWVFGVNVMGVAHGVRAFTPLMLAAADADPAYRGHIVNTASMAGLLNPPNMGLYNASKHAVVSLSESLYQDLSLVSDRVHAHVLCPYFVPTGITRSERNRPHDMHDPAAGPTRSQLIAAGDERPGGEQGPASPRRRWRSSSSTPGREPLLHLQPPQGAGRGADAAGRHHDAAQSQRSVQGQARDRRAVAPRAARCIASRRSALPETPVVAVIGAGPAGLMAAETLAAGGCRVEVFDAMPSVGRKFLLAGVGGLNLTHGEPFEAFVSRYGGALGRAGAAAARLRRRGRAGLGGGPGHRHLRRQLGSRVPHRHEGRAAAARLAAPAARAGRAAAHAAPLAGLGRGRRACASTRRRAR